MGLPGSPTYTIMICTYYEYKFKHSLYDYIFFNTDANGNNIFRCGQYIETFAKYDKNKPLPGNTNNSIWYSKQIPQENIPWEHETKCEDTTKSFIIFLK